MKNIFNFTFYFIRRLNQIAQRNKYSNRLYAYYAFPALIGLFITFVSVRTLVYLLPNAILIVNGTHIHHFTTGILILIVTGYIALWVNSWRIKYITAIAYGSGTAFILDEFYVWLNLDASAISHKQYDAVVMASAILLMILLLPSGVLGFKKLFSKL